MNHHLTWLELWQCLQALTPISYPVYCHGSSSALNLLSLLAAIGTFSILAIMRLDDQPTPPAPLPQALKPMPAQTPPMPRTGLVYHPDCLQHITGATHPEKPERIAVIMDRLRDTGLQDKLVPITCAPITNQWLETIHSAEYIAEVDQIATNRPAYLHSPDTTVSAMTPNAARLAAGAVIAGIDAIVSRQVANAFCVVRPPGHHAGYNHAAGFCIFNNAAIGARYAQMRHNLTRVLIVDWDVHHGDATQTLFYDDPNVLFFSIHQHPFYPGSGAATEIGSGAGAGYTINAPLPAHSGDAEYIQAFEELLRPRALKFQPDFMIISAGFDAMEHDALGGMRITSAGFAQLTRIVRQIAAQTCQGRLLSVLEGGYNLEHLGTMALAHLQELMPPG